jgi:hypothetical protein
MRFGFGFNQLNRNLVSGKRPWPGRPRRRWQERDRQGFRGVVRDAVSNLLREDDFRVEE